MSKIIGILLLVVLAMMSTQPVFLFVLLLLVIVTVFSYMKRLIFRGKVELFSPTFIEGTRGENVEIQFSLKNKSWLPISNCVIHYKIKNTHFNKVEKGTIDTFVGARQEKLASQNLQFQEPGLLEIEVDFIKINGIIPFKYKIQANQAITIWPKVYPIESMLDFGISSRIDAESDQMRQVQSLSDESFGIRAYKMGDSLRQIHWKLSAKLDDLVVLEQHEQVNERIFLSLENCENQEDLNLLNEIYLSIANYFQQQQKNVFVCMDGNEGSLQDIDLKTLKLATLKGSSLKAMDDDSFALVVTKDESATSHTVISIRLVDEQPQAWAIRRNKMEEDLLKLGGQTFV
ncbi:hypothetical protein DF281_10940 [Kurthia zopfii]|uniref:Uncharacterized conserved protein (Some members contain a von Willebrand factor type A (VWA) domain) n=1 Tax=Kurthia zopfii TaxID=1650 RepID=A0A8B4QB90_9BACL|nr:DUF58 domain-containing protein [Kurthia zopfii]PWI21700.1 hypothetical protein DF281_10940 [Kurthia zopfii]TDR35736.1 uncharacterized protein DUF58 [Kurthia zopfii]STX09935.1 Uncharacterized conserved protein (some members contain a von Willebrand factor type A (vWA) domain) [Kurthia zopfii]